MELLVTVSNINLATGNRNASYVASTSFRPPLGYVVIWWVQWTQSPVERRGQQSHGFGYMRNLFESKRIDHREARINFLHLK